MQILEDYCVDHLASTQAFLDIVSPPWVACTCL
jgi:hypothetical protein